MAKVGQAITAKAGAIGKVKIGNYGKCCFVLFLNQSQPKGANLQKSGNLRSYTSYPRVGLQR